MQKVSLLLTICFSMFFAIRAESAANSNTKANLCQSVFHPNSTYLKSQQPPPHRKEALEAYRKLSQKIDELYKTFPLSSSQIGESLRVQAILVKKLLEQDGFKVSEVMPLSKIYPAAAKNYDSAEAVTYLIEIYSGPSSSKVDAVIQHTQNNFGVKFYFEFKPNGSTNGSYSDYFTSIDLSPDHVFLKPGDISNTILHEIVHSAHYAKAAKSIDSPFNASIQGFGDNKVTSVSGYTAYMSFQELSTMTKDYFVLRRGLSNINVLANTNLTQARVAAKKAATALNIARNIQAIVASTLVRIGQLEPSLMNFEAKSIAEKSESQIPIKTRIEHHRLKDQIVFKRDRYSENNWQVSIAYAPIGTSTAIGRFTFWLPAFDKLGISQEIKSISLIMMPPALRAQSMSIIRKKLREISENAQYYEQKLTPIVEP